MPRPPIRRLLLLGLAALTALLLPAAPAGARGGEPAGSAGAVDPLLGPIYFDQTIAWVNDGKSGINNLADFYADLANVQFSVEGNHHEGFMRLWLRQDAKYRIELRPERPLVRRTTKILDGEQMWIVHPEGQVERMHGRPDGAQAVAQLKQDRKRLTDLARFLTLEALKGPGVQFVNEGPKTGSGTFAGQWIKLRRTIAGGADMTFHLAYGRDPRDPTGRAILCTYPGVVTVEGDPRLGEPTEYYLLSDWRSGPQFRYPGRIEAYARATPGATPRRFLLAFPNDIRINTRLEDSLFAPPN